MNRRRPAALLAILAIHAWILTIVSPAAESLADLESYRSGCQSLSDGRFETAAEQFQVAWDLLQESGSGDLERDFVASRLLEAFVRNGDSARAAEWLENFTPVSPSVDTLRWAGLAFYDEQRYAEAADVFAFLFANFEVQEPPLLLSYLNSLALSGAAEEALVFSEERFSPTSSEDIIALARIAALAERPNLAIEYLDELTDGEPLPTSLFHLASRIKLVSLIQLGRTEGAIELACELIDQSKDPEEALYRLLMLEEVGIDPSNQKLESRLSAWADATDHPASAVAEFFLNLHFSSRDDQISFLYTKAKGSENDLLSHEARLRLQSIDASQAVKTPSSISIPALPGEPDRTAFLNASAAYHGEQFEKAATLFLQQSVKQSGSDRFRSEYNSAISSLQGGDIDTFQSTLERLTNDNPKSALIADLRFLGGLFLASEGDPSAFDELQSFIRDYPLHPSNIEARLALSEIHLNQVPARPQAARDIFDELKTQSLTLNQSERLDYTSIWAELIDNQRSELVRKARTFVSEWPNSNYLPEVTMLLGSQYLEDGKHEEAREMFDLIVTKFPNSPHADTARFFAIKSGSADESTLAEWRELTSQDGSFVNEARHELSLLLLNMDRYDEAREEMEALLEALENNNELRYAVLADLGYSYYLESLNRNRDEELLEEASSVFARLTNLPDLPTTWRYNAAVRRAKCLEALQRPNIALEIYRSILSGESGKGDILGKEVYPDQNEWVFRAGFSAIEILREKKDWAGAIKVADTLSSIEGTRAIDAANLAEQLRLKHWVWD